MSGDKAWGSGDTLAGQPLFGQGQPAAGMTPEGLTVWLRAASGNRVAWTVDGVRANVKQGAPLDPLGYLAWLRRYTDVD